MGSSNWPRIWAKRSHVVQGGGLVRDSPRPKSRGGGNGALAGISNRGREGDLILCEKIRHYGRMRTRFSRP